MIARLRQETGALHTQLEKVLPLGAQLLTREHYARFLGVMHAVVPDLEERIANVPGWSSLLPHAEQRRRAALLRCDLEVLGAHVARAPLRCQLPVIDAPACAFGASYVLEGSTLGGVVIARTLGPTLALTPERGLGFLCAYGSQLRERWSEFVAALETWSASASERERDLTVATARATFEAFVTQATSA
jgi:heme oxygenase